MLSLHSHNSHIPESLKNILKLILNHILELLSHILEPLSHILEPSSHILESLNPILKQLSHILEPPSIILELLHIHPPCPLWELDLKPQYHILKQILKQNPQIRILNLVLNLPKCILHLILKPPDHIPELILKLLQNQLLILDPPSHIPKLPPNHPTPNPPSHILELVWNPLHSLHPPQTPLP